MDRLIYWFDSINMFSSLGAWVWALITAVVAIGALVGIVHAARHYGNAHNALAD